MLRINIVFLAQFHSSHSSESERLHGKGVYLTEVSSSTKYFRHFVRQFISPSLGTRHYSPSSCWKELVLGWEEEGRRRR